MAIQKEPAKIITISAVIGEDRHLVIDLPVDAPTGPVEVVIRAKQVTPTTTLTREEARAKLLAAGALVTDIHAPEDTTPLTPEERMEIGKMPPGTRPSEELIDEDRGLY